MCHRMDTKFSLSTEDPSNSTAQSGGRNESWRRIPPPLRPVNIEQESGDLHILFQKNSCTKLKCQPLGGNMEKAAPSLVESRLAATPSSDSGRERLKRHRDEVAGRVSIPDRWGQENFLKDWIDYSTFDALLAPKGVSSAREALIAEGQRATSQRLRIGSRC